MSIEKFILLNSGPLLSFKSFPEENVDLGTLKSETLDCSFERVFELSVIWADFSFEELSIAFPSNCERLCLSLGSLFIVYLSCISSFEPNLSSLNKSSVIDFFKIGFYVVVLVGLF